MDQKKKKKDRSVTREKKNTSTKVIGLPSTSETAGENETDDLPAVGPAAVKGKRKREKTRKYTDNYLKFGFTFKETDGIEFPMCVICSTVLSNESMKPSKLQRHLETTHSHIKDKPVDYFKTYLKSLQGQQTLMKKSAKVGELALKCSYQVALRIAQKKQPYTIGEDLILPSTTDMCKTIYGNDIDINKLKIGRCICITAG